MAGDISRRGGEESKVMSKIGYVLIGIGITIMIGTAGASDAGTYTLWQSVIWVLAGAVIGEIGAVLVEIEKRRR